MSNDAENWIMHRAARLLLMGRAMCRNGEVLCAASNSGKLTMLAEHAYTDARAHRIMVSGARLFQMCLDKQYGKGK